MIEKLVVRGFFYKVLFGRASAFNLCLRFISGCHSKC